MRIGWAAAVCLAVAFLAAKAQAEVVPRWFAVATPAPPINSPAFVRRAPLPGQPTFLQSIGYVESRIRYIDPLRGFFISPVGEMCFRTSPNSPKPVYDDYYQTWCAYPGSIGRLELMTNAVTNINGVRLWCMHGFPRCLRSIGEVGWTANSIYVEAIDYRQVQTALANLMFMMGAPMAAAEPADLPPRAEIR